MKILKNTLITLLALLVLLSPVIAVGTIIAATPRSFSNTIYGELDDKFSRLTSVEEDKIIVVGGSSVAFGLDSALLESLVGMPVVDFGLYAAIGTKAMLDLSLAGVSSGDVVVIAPELDAQTTSMYFSAEHMLPAVDENYLMALYLRGNSLLSLVGGAFSFAEKKLSYNGDIPDPDGIYNVRSFNGYGDIKNGLRPSNVMQLYYDPSTPISLSSEIFDEDFLDYLNEYAAICESRGAKVLFSYCPINEAALTDGSENVRGELEDFLKERLEFEVISNIYDYIYDKAYFYDTNFHLNDTGVTLRTRKLAQDLLIALGKFTVIDTEVPAPELPEVDVRYFGEDDENAALFTYERLYNGAYAISGLTEKGKRCESLTIPLGYEGYKVTAIASGAFSEGVATRVTVTADSNLRNFLNGCFADCSVRDVYIHYTFTEEENKLAPASDFYGINIHVPLGSVYTQHYDWLESSDGYNMIPDIIAE